MKLKNLMLLSATMLMAFSLSSCSKDDDGKDKVEDEKWDFTNGLSDLKVDGSTIAFATSSFDAFAGVFDIELKDGSSIRQDFKQTVFRYGFDKDENLTSGSIIVSCTNENSTKELAAMLEKMFDESQVTVNSTQIVISDEGYEPGEAMKSDIEYLYYTLYGFLNNDGSKATISDLSYDGIEYTWTITYGGERKALGIVSITKHYAADDRPGKPVECHYAEVMCKDEATAQLIARLEYGYDDECTVSVDGSTIYIEYTQDSYDWMESQDITSEYNFDKEYLSMIYE